MVLSPWQSHCERVHPVHLINADSAPRRPPTLRPSQPTWTASPPERNDRSRAVAAVLAVVVATVEAIVSVVIT